MKKKRNKAQSKKTREDQAETSLELSEDLGRAADEGFPAAENVQEADSQKEGEDRADG